MPTDSALHSSQHLTGYQRQSFDLFLRLLQTTGFMQTQRTKSIFNFLINLTDVNSILKFIELDPRFLKWCQHPELDNHWREVFPVFARQVNTEKPLQWEPDLHPLAQLHAWHCFNLYLQEYYELNLQQAEPFLDKALKLGSFHALLTLLDRDPLSEQSFTLANQNAQRFGAPGFLVLASVALQQARAGNFKSYESFTAALTMAKALSPVHPEKMFNASQGESATLLTNILSDRQQDLALEEAAKYVPVAVIVQQTVFSPEVRETLEPASLTVANNNLGLNMGVS